MTSAFATAHRLRKNLSRITAREYDAIIEALRAEPDNIAGIATRFNRGPETIQKLRAKRFPRT